MLIADYTASRAKKFLTLSLLSNGRREHVETVTVAGKIEARRIAAERGAKCWNF
jgi:hypothetical protein